MRHACELLFFCMHCFASDFCESLYFLTVTSLILVVQRVRCVTKWLDLEEIPLSFIITILKNFHFSTQRLSGLAGRWGGSGCIFDCALLTEELKCTHFTCTRNSKCNACFQVFLNRQTISQHSERSQL